MITIHPLTTPEGRKQRPLVTGVLDYFPDALLEVALCSYVGNEQHNPGTPLHWDRSKSQDEADACGRHLKDRGTVDTDGVRHSAKAAWRALALLQKEIEAERATKTEPNMYANLRVQVEPVNVTDALRYRQNEGYTRFGVRCCSVENSRDKSYDCSLPFGHAGSHCDTAYPTLSAGREWD